MTKETATQQKMEMDKRKKTHSCCLCYVILKFYDASNNVLEAQVTHLTDRSITLPSYTFSLCTAFTVQWILKRQFTHIRSAYFLHLGIFLER